MHNEIQPSEIGPSLLLAMNRLLGQHSVSPDGKPDHVALASTDLRPVGEDRSPISGPGHLKTTRHAPNTLDSETTAISAMVCVVDEVGQRPFERHPLLDGQVSVPTLKSVSYLVRRHAELATALP